MFYKIPLTFRKSEQSPIQHTQLVLSILAAFIATLVLHHKHGIIDPDSVLYLEAARLFSLSQWHEAYQVYPWPFYSLCISGVHKLSMLSIHDSAVLLNILFFTLVTFFFLKIIELCGGKKLEILMGALILFSSHQIVENSLGIFMRDLGFWAFLLAALMFFMRFYKSHSFIDALCWQISIIFATLFRIEGIGFLFLLPFALFNLNKDQALQNISTFLKANFLNIGLMVALFSAALISNQLSIQDLGRLHEIFSKSAYQEFIGKFTINTEIMSSLVLGKFLNEYAAQGLLLTLVYACSADLIKTTGRLTSLLGLLGMRQRKPLIDSPMQRVLYFCLCIAALNLAIISIKAFVITHRYAVAFSFFWMIFSTFYLAHLWNRLHESKCSLEKILTVFAIGFLSVSLVRNLLPQSNDTLIQQKAAAWLKIENVQNAPVFHDESRTRYYANEPFNGKFNRYNKVIEQHINDRSILNYQYLLINFSNDYAVYEDYVRKSTPEFMEVKRFCSKDGGVCSVIFKKTRF